MLIGLATYLAGYHTLVEPPPSAVRAHAHAIESTANRRIVLALIAVMTLTIFDSVAYLQLFNIGFVWISQHVKLDPFGFEIPVAWFSSIGALSSIASCRSSSRCGSGRMRTGASLAR
jgi:Dipeptide/tripeptide permease